MALYLRKRIDKWDYMKFKNFYKTKKCSSESRGSTKNRKILNSFISDGLITRIYRELNKLKTQGRNGQIN
jgi:hypothetical protein